MSYLSNLDNDYSNQWWHQGKCQPASEHSIGSLKNKIYVIKNIFLTQTFYFLDPGSNKYEKK
jgi:hypothetical protein